MAALILLYLPGKALLCAKVHQSSEETSEDMTANAGEETEHISRESGDNEGICRDQECEGRPEGSDSQRATSAELPLSFSITDSGTCHKLICNQET